MASSPVPTWLFEVHQAQEAWEVWLPPLDNSQQARGSCAGPRPGCCDFAGARLCSLPSHDTPLLPTPQIQSHSEDLLSVSIFTLKIVSLTAVPEGTQPSEARCDGRRAPVPRARGDGARRAVRIPTDLLSLRSCQKKMTLVQVTCFMREKQPHSTALGHHTGQESPGTVTQTFHNGVGP